MNNKTLIKIVGLFLLAMFSLSYVYSQTYQVPGADILYNTTETKTPSPAEYLNTSGGSFTTMILSSETQNLKWKAYIGNVTGVLTLDDSGNYSIYQWQLTSFTGEVYASRVNNITWSNIKCANLTHIENEEIAMNHTTSNVDSINNTFNSMVHREFFVGTIKINESSCKSTFTWVNDTQQSASVTAPFQEVLLTDNNALVYTTFVNDNTQGFNYNRYDFQMIVAERGIGGYENTRYYFYLELD